MAFDEQNERYNELSTLSLGYIFYQVGKFPTALKYFGNVAMTSPYYLDATFASGPAFPRALTPSENSPSAIALSSAGRSTSTQ